MIVCFKDAPNSKSILSFSLFLSDLHLEGEFLTKQIQKKRKYIKNQAQLKETQIEPTSESIKAKSDNFSHFSHMRMWKDF